MMIITILILEADVSRTSSTWYENGTMTIGFKINTNIKLLRSSMKMLYASGNHDHLQT